MNAPVRDLADRLDVRWQSRVDALARTGHGWMLDGDAIDGGAFDAAVIAIPAEQATPLVAPHRAEWAELARATRSEPCWTVMAAYSRRLPIETDRLIDRGILASCVRNSAKPGRTGVEAWVLQAGGAWSATHLEADGDRVERELLRAFATVAGQELPVPVATSRHRWRYAKSGRLGETGLWDGSLRLGLCGDWLIAGRVEAAWLSGRWLAQAMVAA